MKTITKLVRASREALVRNRKKVHIATLSIIAITMFADMMMFADVGFLCLSFMCEIDSAV